MERVTEVVWDLDDEVGGNVVHIGEHGLTKEDVEAVLEDPWYEGVSHTGRPCRYGESGGRILKVVFEWVDPGVVYPVTAFEIALD